MKNKKHISVIIAAFIMFFPACKEHKPQGNETMMAMDTEYASDKNATIVHPKDTIRLSEETKKFEDNSNITQTDIDAGNKVQSKEVRYVSGKESIKIDEPKPETK